MARVLSPEELEEIRQWYDRSDPTMANLLATIDAYELHVKIQDGLIGQLKETIDAMQAVVTVMERLANPIAYFQSEAERLGHNLDGVMAIKISESFGWYREEAKAALADLKRKQGESTKPHGGGE